jgi:hypothetical protein
MAFLSWFCIFAGTLFIAVGFLIAVKMIIVYEDKVPEGILSQTSHEVIGSDLMLSGVISLGVGTTELLIPEFRGRLFYFLIVSLFILALMMSREKSEKDGGN